MTLIATESLKILWLCSRRFSVSCVGRNLQREARFLQKLMSQDINRKLEGNPSPQRAVQVLSKRRRDVLNKYYMTHISEIMSYGAFEQLSGRGLQITRVDVTKTGTVEVFWLANESEDPVQLQALLSSIAGRVAHELVNSYLLGQCPLILFRRDIAAVQSTEVDRLLRKISFESALEDNTTDVEDDISQQLLEAEEEAAPPMRLDTLGLPYGNILKRIQTARIKCFPVEMPVPPTTEELQISSENSPVSSGNSVQNQHKRKKELKKFIALYQKSALRSGARTNNLTCKENADQNEDYEDFKFYENDVGEDDEDDVEFADDVEGTDDVDYTDDVKYTDDVNDVDDNREEPSGRKFVNIDAVKRK